jgi:enoyl-CoA hydratase/carnithine racemase
VDTYQKLLYKEDDGVAVVTLNRPEVHNAFDHEMQMEMRSMWQALRRNDDVRAIILTGAGEEAFCSGIDRAEAIENDYLIDEDRRRNLRSSTGPASSPFQYNDPGVNINPKENDLWKPVIAAVNGMCCAGGLYLLGECDILIASDNATFFDPHVTYGMVASFESIHLLQKLPLGETIRLALLGAHERISAQRAHQMGLVSEVVPYPELAGRAQWIAERIASAPTSVIQATLQAAWAGHEHSRRQALDLAHVYVGLGSDIETLGAGQATFAEHDRADWQLR